MKNRSQTDGIEARLTRIEVSAKRWRGVAIVLGMVMSGGVIAGFTANVSSEISTNRLAIVDNQGVEKLVLLVSDEDVPAIFFIDPNNDLRIRIMADEDGPIIEMYDDREVSRMTLTVGENGPNLLQFNKKGSMRVGVSTDENGGRISVSDQANKQVGYLGQD